jgi:glycosyltransferase involved in cell wall biosynthesis
MPAERSILILMPHSCHISVLMPVYNAAQFVGTALASLAAQRGVTFEVVAVDDGSTDGSSEVLASAKKQYHWLRVFSQPNAGVAQALNRGLAEVRGDLIARMDADDVAMPDRLKLQAELLEREPAVGVCGSWFQILGRGFRGVVKVPVTDAAIHARLVFGSAFAHPSVMMRRSLFAGLTAPYDPAQEGFEDYGLWLRLAERTRFESIPRVLLNYRMHLTQATRRYDPVRRRKLEKMRRDFLERYGIVFSADEGAVHDATCFGADSDVPPSTIEMQAWLLRLANELPRSGWCDSQTMAGECADAWERFLRRHFRGWRGARLYFKFPLVHARGNVIPRVLRFVLPR